MNEQDTKIKRELGALVEAGAFIKEEARVVSPTFLVPKRDGTSRLIHDLRGVNRCLEAPHFTLRGARDAGEVTRTSKFLAVLDLRHGYQQVAMEPAARPFLGARLGRETVTSTVLPFGLSLSPYVFTRLTGWLARLIRRRLGLQVAVYIDDFLLGAGSREELENGIREVKSLFSRLGVVISSKKEVLPAHEVEFIGFRWNALTKRVGVPRERRAEYRRAIKNHLRHPQTRDTWRRVIGKLGFLRGAVGPAMRHVRSLLHAVATRKGGRLIAAEGEARQDLLWWLETLGRDTELSLDIIPVTASLATDASDCGLGFIVTCPNGNEPTRQIQRARSPRADNPRAHINCKEIEALLHGLEEHRQELHGRKVVWYSDSTTAVAAIRRQGTQKLSPATREATKSVLDLAVREGISILPKHVPGRLNGAADALSRGGKLVDEWQAALEAVAREWGPLEEDPCGATREPTSLLESLEWATRRTLIWPKVWEIPHVLGHIELAAAVAPPEKRPNLWDSMAVVISPLWRGATWWPRLAALRAAFLPLGRLASPDTRQWARRNGHKPEWTASLIPLATRSGPRAPERSTRGRSAASSSGKRSGASPPTEQAPAKCEA